MKQSALRCVLVSVLLPGLSAQPPAAFEVASVRLSTSGFNGVRGGCHGIDSQYGSSELAPPPLGRCVITDGRLSHLISIAYQLNAISQIKGAADWVIAGDDRFTIQAKAEHPEKATEKELLQMLQALLEDRFNLKFHRENKDLPGFALVVAKNGPKLQAAKGDESGMNFGPSGKPGLGGPAVFNARRCSILSLAQMLTTFGPGPVADQTGLQGLYDIKLAWDETNGPSLFTAVQEQLGLRLESRKVPVSFFVIESAQKPSEN
jgi:uncharacterized protein (TIGR03435 family)